MAKTSTASKVAEKAQVISDTATDVAQNTYANVKDLAQTTYESAKDVVQTALGNGQENVQAGARKGAAKTALGLGAAMQLFNRSQKQSKKGLKKAQEVSGNAVDTLQDVSSNVADTVQNVSSNVVDSVKPRLAATTAALGAGLRAAQERNEIKKQRKKRARTLFRWGLVIGIVLTLLYSPYTGEEVRQRIMEQWDQYKSYLGL